jgi:hypothetical protein
MEYTHEYRHVEHSARLHSKCRYKAFKYSINTGQGSSLKYTLYYYFFFILFNIHVAIYVTLGQVNIVCNYNRAKNRNYSHAELSRCNKTLNTAQTS